MSRDRSPPSRRPAGELPLLLVGPPILTLAAAESVTCGHVQAEIGAVSGSSLYFLGGITAYTLQQKVRHLRVDAAAAEAVDAVSAEVAAEMAIGACRLFHSDLAVATTGYAEANEARGFAQPGAFWAVARSGNGGITIVRHGFFEGGHLSRTAMQAAAAEDVLRALVDYLRFFREAEKQSVYA